jgi:hypothetical protein
MLGFQPISKACPRVQSKHLDKISEREELKALMTLAIVAESAPLKLLADENLDNTIIRGLFRRSPTLDIVRV